MRFQGKVAVVTGAAQGIGEAYARALAAEGAAFDRAELDALLDLAGKGCVDLTRLQQEALASDG